MGPAFMLHLKTVPRFRFSGGVRGHRTFENARRLTHYMQAMGFSYPVLLQGLSHMTFSSMV